MNQMPTKLLGDDVVDRLNNPTGLSFGLPSSAFTRSEFFDRECETVFQNNWIFVGHTHDIPNPGDVKPVMAGKLPILLVRSKDGEIKAFHNACRHRGMKLVEEPCSGQRTLTCPYHAWSYDLDGKLRAAPFFGGTDNEPPRGFDPAELGLRPIRCAVWRWWICVNVDGNAPAFEEHLKPLLAQIGDYDFSRLTPAIRRDFGVVKGNWKSILENFMEPYHVYVVHSHSCGGQPLASHFVVNNNTLTGSGVNLPDAPPLGMAHPAGFERTQLEDNALYVNLFPNFALGFYGEIVLSILTHPISPSETWEQFDLYLPHDQASDPVALAAWDELNAKINFEDIEMIERLQRGLKSPVMNEGAVMSPHWENCLQRFETLIAQGVNGFGGRCGQQEIGR
jgi:choline monooxygenase